MILIDDRVGSVDLLRPLESIGADAIATRLEFGDALFPGNGPRGPIAIGVERKRFPADFLASMTSKRFTRHQLPGLAASCSVVFLIVEGIYKPDEYGALMVMRGPNYWEHVTLGKRRFQLEDLEGYLTTLEQQGGLYWRRSSSRSETARLILGQYRWWQRPWGDHKSLEGFHIPPLPRIEFGDPTFPRRVAKECDWVGWEKSELVARHFGSVRKMALATVTEWMAIPGIGKVIAGEAVKKMAENPYAQNGEPTRDPVPTKPPPRKRDRRSAHPHRRSPRR